MKGLCSGYLLKMNLIGSMDPSALNSRSISNNSLLFRSLFTIDPVTNLPVPAESILTANGQGGYIWKDPFTVVSDYSLATGSGLGFLPSTISTLSTNIHVLSNYVYGYAAPISVTNLNSTVNGLGTLRYVSSTQLRSTVDGLGSAGYISTSGFLTLATNTVDALLTSTVTSTNIGLGTFGYVSTPSLQSSLMGLGTLGYVSTPSLQSTLIGLGTLGYVSTPSIQSTFVGISKIQTSTVAGLGNAGYISSLSLQSTVAKLLTNISIDTAGYVTITNANVSISSVNGGLNVSNVSVSSITYKGTNGPVTASTFQRDWYFSTANLQLSSFSKYIQSNSRLILDIYPNFLFCYMTDPQNYNTTQQFTLSTFLTYKNSNLLMTTNNSLFVASSYANNTSNAFQIPMRLSVIGSNLLNAAAPNFNLTSNDDFVVTHRLINAGSSNLSPGFRNSNIQLYMASTNSVYLSVQNNSL